MRIQECHMSCPHDTNTIGRCRPMAQVFWLQTNVVSSLYHLIVIFLKTFINKCDIKENHLLSMTPELPAASLHLLLTSIPFLLRSSDPQKGSGIPGELSAFQVFSISETCLPLNAGSTSHPSEQGWETWAFTQVLKSMCTALSSSWGEIWNLRLLDVSVAVSSLFKKSKRQGEN